MKFLFFLFLITSYTFSQEKELDIFKEKLNFLIDYQLGKLDSITRSKIIYQEVVNQVDDSFKDFVNSEDSYNCYNCRVSSLDKNIKFFEIDKKTQIVLHTFIVNNKTFVSYSYRSFSKQNYFIKDIEKNVVIYQGNGKTFGVENIFEIENDYYILIEKHGDRRESREIMILQNTNNSWKQINGFEGKELNNNLELEYKSKRPILSFYCDGIEVFNYPEINILKFDKNSKTISHKKYLGKNKFEIITSTWKDKKFIIDDYYAYGSLYN